MAQKWLVEIVVADSWVADGYNLTDEVATNMLHNSLPFAHDSEIAAQVIQAPEPKIIAGLQDGSIEIADDLPVSLETVAQKESP